MARIRTVKPALFASYSLAKVPIEARYLFVGLFTLADDDGRLVDSAKQISGAVYPHDDAVTANMVDGWLAALADVGSICRYSVNGGRYIALPAWKSHQRVPHPMASQIPSPESAISEVVKRDARQRRSRAGPEAVADLIPEALRNISRNAPE